MTTKYPLTASLAFAAAFLTSVATMPVARAATSASGVVVITNGPQSDPGDGSRSWSAPQNVRDSQRYEALLHSNNSFRARRVRRECGPIDDPRLHADCVASFE